MKRLLFIDRDGTLIEEPADEQIDSFDKLKFTKGMFRNLGFIRAKLDLALTLVQKTPSGLYITLYYRLSKERALRSTRYS